MGEATAKLRIGIFGGSGYGGSELLRILLAHPNAEIAVVTANEHAEKPVGEVHRNLFGLTDLIFQKAPDDPGGLANLDCIFLALPHGQAMDIVPRLPAQVKVIDLSGDFRLRDKDEFAQHYGREHTAIEAQSDFVYGLTETNREADPHSPVNQQSRMLCDCNLARAGATCRKPIHQRAGDRGREDGLIGFRRESRRQHASPAADELVLRLQAFHASACAGDRTGAASRGRMAERVYFYDTFAAGGARHFFVDLRRNRKRDHRGRTSLDLQGILPRFVVHSDRKRIAGHQLGEDH